MFQTVLSYDFAKFKYHDSEDSHGFDNEDEVERLPKVSKAKKGGLPNISSSEPGSWWLGQFLSGEDDWKEWYLVNFKKQRMVVGPMGQGTEWPEHLNLEDFHFWSPEWVKELFYDEEYA
jgi:hypothetical protein